MQSGIFAVAQRGGFRDGCHDFDGQGVRPLSPMPASWWRLARSLPCRRRSCCPDINPDTSAGSLFIPLFLRGLGSVCMFLPLSLATLGDLPLDKVSQRLRLLQSHPAARQQHRHRADHHRTGPPRSGASLRSGGADQSHQSGRHASPPADDRSAFARVSSRSCGQSPSGPTRLDRPHHQRAVDAAFVCRRVSLRGARLFAVSPAAPFSRQGPQQVPPRPH